MNFFKNTKKPGFTLMEIALAVLIVAILALTLIPVIHSQMQKSDEYSYYMAYRTIEKLGGQIVALGDEEEWASRDSGVKIAEAESKARANARAKILANKKKQHYVVAVSPMAKLKFFFASLGARFAYSEHYLFKKLFPKSYAEVTYKSIFEGAAYDSYMITLQYCAGKDVCDPNSSNKDLYKKECDGNGSNCVTKAKCDQNGANCCNADKLNLSDAPSCNPSYSFKQKYRKCTKVKTKTTCAVDEEGNKVDPDCKEEWKTTETCEDNLESCSTSTSDPNTTITCTKTNSYKETTSCHILRPVDVQEYIKNGEGINSCPTKEDQRNYVQGFFGNDSCSLVPNATEDMSSEAYTEAVNSAADSMINAMISGTYASTFCTTYVGKYCTYASDDAQPYFNEDCFLKTESEEIVDNVVGDESWERPTVDDICTSEYGYYGMRNYGTSAGGGKYYNTNCQCETGKIVTENNSKVCCNAPENPTDLVYATSSNTCVACATDFNPGTNECCPEFSVYNGTKCECVEGYTYSESDKQCHHTSCSKGSHMDEKNEVCVPNVPILKARRLCEKIADNWNIQSSYCTGFTDGQYNSDVFNAAKGTDNQFLSIKSKDGAFATLRPHVVLANGLKLWILGDKMASIPGLSFNPTNISNKQNICKDVTDIDGANPKTTQTTCLASNGEYLCAGEKHCFTLDSDSLDKMGDARNCCSASDVTDLLNGNPDEDNRAFAINGFTVFVDINNDKGAGTLWEDVFPFYVSANGMVYPGYPLNADKKKTATSSSLYLAGNSASMLPTDVYYYETDSDSDKRKRYIAYPNVSFARAACQAKWVGKNTPYCMNLGNKYKDHNGTNPCDSHKCFVSVRNKLRMF